MNADADAQAFSDAEGHFDKYPIQLAGACLLGKRYWCAWCGGEIFGFKDRRSAAEFRQTGACQPCQDKVFDDEKPKKDVQYDLPLS
jgi:hypothetical protein